MFSADITKAQEAVSQIEDKAIRDVATQLIPVIAAAAQSIVDSFMLNLQKTLADTIDGVDNMLKERIGQTDDALAERIKQIISVKFGAL